MYAIKNFKTFKGHEGEPCARGTLHGPSGKVATWSDDSWGGPMRVTFTSNAEEASFVAFCKTYLADKKDYEGAPYGVEDMPGRDLIEAAISAMSFVFEAEKELVKHARTGIAYYLPDTASATGQALYVTKAPFTADNVAKLRAKHPNIIEVVNERLKLPFVDPAQFKLAQENKRFKAQCKKWTLFSVRDASGAVKVMVIKGMYTDALGEQIRHTYPNTIEIINDRFS